MSTEPTPSAAPYPPPLDRLLALGEMGARRREWLDYVAMGFGAEHVPELLRMAADEALHRASSDDPRVFAPLHAWRVLGQLRAAEAAAPLAGLLLRYEDDWARENLPRVLGLIGAPAIEPARAILADASAAPFTRVAAAAALHETAVRHPDLRDEVVALLTAQLRSWPEQGETVNAFLIDYLVELDAVEAADLMRAAFEAGAADVSVRGDWEDVQVDLALLSGRVTPPPPPPWLPRPAPRTGVVVEPPPSGARARRKAKNRRREEKQSRKRNRRK